MAEFPALPLWTDAYLADTTHLSEAEHGRYMLFLIHLWRAPLLRFPNDDGWLARKFGKTVLWVEISLRPLIAEFCQCDGNWITQKRMQREWKYVSAASKRQSVRSKRRWNKEKDASHGNAAPHASGNAPTPTPTPTPLVRVEAPAKRAPTTGTRWAASSSVSEDWLGDAQAARIEHQLPEIDLRLEAERFANFWSAKSGKDATKVDWRRTWINWVLNSKGQQHGKQTAHANSLAGFADAIRDELAGRAGRADQGGEDDPFGQAARALPPPRSEP